MTYNQERYMVAMLECGTEDVSLLDDVNFDIWDIVQALLDEGIKPTLEAVLNEAFNMALDNVYEDWETLVADTETELERIGDERKLAWEECSDRLIDLKSLDPRHDIHFVFNYLASGIEYEDSDKEELYHQYLQESLDQASQDFGWSF